MREEGRRYGERGNMDKEEEIYDGNIKFTFDRGIER